MLSIKINKIKKLAALVSAALILFGCSAHHTIAPPPIFTAQPLEEETGYYSKELKEQCVYTYMEFIGQEEDLFLFYVEIENILEDGIVVHPAEIYLEVIEEKGNPIGNNTMRYFAIDPEREIAEINRMIKEEESRHSGATAENIIWGVFNVIAAFASDIENKEEAVIVDVFNTGMNQVDEEVFHSDVEKELAEIKDFWENEVLNHSIVEPGETVGGFVYLPFSKRAEVFKVLIPVGENPHSYLFRQVQIN
jgi:hypothetical protein